MSTRIAINGFGRIGRLALRAVFDRASSTRASPLESALEVVHINEHKGVAKTAAHLVEFDSVHGRWNRQIEAHDSAIQIDSTRVGSSSVAAPGDLAWDSLGVDIVLECSGKFRTADALEAYFRRGVRKVIVAAPVPQGALNIVMGINDHLYKPDEHHLLTAASCTTNCLAPVVKVIHETPALPHGVITPVHDATNTQTVVDAPHKDLRRARSTLMSLIPTSTGSATAIGLIYPELQGKLNGIAVRVPLLNASLTDCVFEVSRPTTVEEVNNALAAAARGPLKGILGFETRPLVSIDYVNDPRSGIVDALSTMVIDGTQVKVLVWYDNEFGYAHRLVELAAKVAARL